MDPRRPSGAQMRALMRRDPRLAEVLRRVPSYPGFPDAAHGARFSHYELLARAIVFQQLAQAAAQTIHDRVCALTPGTKFPRPAELLALPEARLRGAGLSAAKLAALRDLATRIENGELRLSAIARAADETVIERLVAVRGIGRWTAQMFLLFRLGRLDVFAPDDLGLREGARILDGLPDRPTPRALLERAEVWRPLRSVASWALWRLADESKPGRRP